MAFCLWYALLFGQRQSPAAAASLVAAWAWSLALSLLVLEPLLLLGALVWALLALPALAAALAWLPGGLGRAAVGPAVADALGFAGAPGALAGRLELITLPRAAAAAGGLPAHAALAAFEGARAGVSAAVAAAKDFGVASDHQRDSELVGLELRRAYAAAYKLPVNMAYGGGLADAATAV